MATKRIGVVFPGYGEQFIGMGKDLYDELRIVQEFFEQAAGTAETNFVKLMFASSDEEISSIRYSYIAIYLYEASLYQVLHERGLKPDFVAGHGIGEYAAAYAARGLSFIDALYILNKYAQFYDEFIKDKPYEVLRIVRDFDILSLEALCQDLGSADQPAYIASQNSYHAFYVAGHEKTVEKIRKHCVDEVIRKVRFISTAYGMHSTLVDPVVDQLKLYYNKIKFEPLQIPLITNVDGVYVTTSDALESAFMRKINNRIQWLEVIKGFEGCDVILSVGPGAQLVDWFKEVYPDKEYHIISTLSDLQTIEHILQPSVESTTEQTQQEMTPSQEPKIPSNDIDMSEQPKDLYEADLINEKSTDFDIDDEE
ncbi:acyltransferase domain-containing protein [Candidatus Babeliales bacterium]|nr:acyltransferase domain-containing protein [Candidatus Babeliales bacterium]